MAAKSKANANRTRRGEQIQNNVYMSGDLTEAEAMDPAIIRLNMKQYNANLSKNTTFFTDYDPEQILKGLTNSLNKNNTPYEISNKTWKITF